MPEGVYWDSDLGSYAGCAEDSYIHDARLDTFTRCQETTDVYVSLVDEMVMEIEGLAIAAYGCVPQQSQDILDRAKQIMEQKK
ncbi:hypothetical protein D3C87_1789200 [compost metagenome]